MSTQEVYDVAIAYVRGEPMDIEERSRLERDLSSSDLLNELVEEQRLLSAGLDAVRRENRLLGPTAAQEAALLRYFHAMSPRPPNRGARFRGWRNAAAVAATAAVIAVTAFGVLRPASTPDPRQPPSISAVVEPARAGDEFMPLPYGRTIERGEEFTVVRVRLGLMGLLHAGVPLPNPLQGGFVNAELLLGGDGAVKGIRFIDPVRPTDSHNIEQTRLEDQI